MQCSYNTGHSSSVRSCFASVCFLPHIALLFFQRRNYPLWRNGSISLLLSLWRSTSSANGQVMNHTTLHNLGPPTLLWSPGCSHSGLLNCHYRVRNILILDQPVALWPMRLAKLTNWKLSTNEVGQKSQRSTFNKLFAGVQKGIKCILTFWSVVVAQEI